MATRNDSIDRVVLYCSFCGKSQHEVRKLVAGPNVYICNECVHLCEDIVADEDTPTRAPTGEKLPTPEEIVAQLDLHIIGQRTAKETLAVAAYHHYRRMANRSRAKNAVEVQKSNIILIGPTASGKTHTVETLARLLNVPYAKEDLTRITGAGWQGGDVSDVLKALLHNAGGDVARAEFGVILCDEVDKLGGDSSSLGNSKGFGQMVQNALLTMVEGTDVEIPSPSTSPMNKEVVTINTKNILFIFAGAFDGLEDIIAKRMDKGGSMGFSGNPRGGLRASKSLFHHVMSEDLVRFGFDSQFIGRLPVLAVLDELDEAMLASILTEPRNSLFNQFAEKMKWDGVELAYETEAVAEIAKMAIQKKTGARGLRTICEKIFHSTFLLLPTLQKAGKKVVKVYLTARHVREGLPPDLIYDDQKLLK
jgi:ATP-dependent Clp protease ATP-binding subunit ClpX